MKVDVPSAFACASRVRRSSASSLSKSISTWLGMFCIGAAFGAGMAQAGQDKADVPASTKPATEQPPVPSRPAEGESKVKAADADTKSSGPPEKSLDELLGVPEDAGVPNGSAEEASAREQEHRLARSLDEAALDDLVRQALDGMKDASRRLEREADPGLGTQRIQEQVVKTLDRLLEEAQRQQQKSSSSSSRSKNSSGRQQQSEPSEKNGQQNAGSKDQTSRNRSDQNSRNPSATDGQSDSERTRDDAGSVSAGELAETRIEWGQLPERVRELVLQGRRDRVSSLYERMTREYYRRLAEEASR